MKLKLITKIADLSALEPEWRNLLNCPHNDGIHHRYDWFMAGFLTFHENDQLYVMTVIDENDKLSAIAPLLLTSGLYRGIKVNKISFVKNEQSPSNAFILTEGKEKDCVDLFVRHLLSFNNWDLVDLCKVHVDSVTGNYLQKAFSNHSCKLGVKENIRSPFIRIDKGWDEFWKGRSQRFRKSMRNKINHAMKLGNPVVEKIQVTNANIPELEVILGISAASWKHVLGTDLLSRKDNWLFYKKISDLLGPKGLVYIWSLKFDAVPVAFEYHIQYKNVVYPIRADYDESYRGISPGSILEYEIIKGVFDDKRASEYNSCGHTYGYLLNWTDTSRAHENYELFANSIKMSILYNLEYKLLGMLRKTKLFQFLKKMKVM